MCDILLPTCSANNQTIPEKRNPPDISLDHIINYLSDYIYGFSMFKNYKKEIENEYEIEKDENDCWSDDDIGRVWGETQRMPQDSKEKKKTLLILMMEMLKRRPEYTQIQDEPDLSTYERLFEIKSSTDEKRTKIDQEKKKGFYIRVPFTKRFGKKTNFSSEPVPENTQSQYKLIDRDPLTFTATQNELFHITTTTDPYVLLYDTRTCNAAWSYEILNQSTLENKIVGPPFQVDPKLPERYQTPESLDSYGDSYDRGHLAPAANHRLCFKDKMRTNRLSNISPQCRGLNRGIWKTLENCCRKLTKETDVHNVHVYSGPLYLRDNSVQCLIGGKAVPTHFFKVVIVEEEDGTVWEPKCFKMPNKQIEIDDVELVDIEVIERESGVKFTEQSANVKANDEIWTVAPHESFRPVMKVRISHDLQ